MCCSVWHRVLAYNISKGEVFVLVANLSFPNGIQLSHDKQTLLVNEFNLRRILRVHLQGDNKGEINTDGNRGILLLRKKYYLDVERYPQADP